MHAAKARRGGLDRYFYGLTSELPRNGIEVHRLVVGDPVELDEGEFATCVSRDEDHLITRGLKIRAAAHKLLRSNDLLVSHFAAYTFCILDQLRNRPLVVHFHGPWALERAAEGANPLAVAAQRAVERIVYRRATRVIVLSQAFANVLETEYGVQADKIRIIPGGVDLNRFVSHKSRDAAREQLGWPLDRPIVFCVRRLYRAKGLDNLIDAVPLIRRSIPDAMIVIAGTGPMASELREQVSRLQLSQSVFFAGFVPEAVLPDMYRAADLVVVPTMSLEGFGLVVVESLACGTPVVVTPIAGLPEVVAGLDPNLILAGATPRDIACGISGALLGNFKVPSDAQCKQYAQTFSWPNIASQVAAIYRETLT